MHDLPRYGDSPAFSERERLVLDLAVEMTRTRVDIPAQLSSALRAHFTEAQLVELAANVAWENYRARFNRVFGVQPVGFSEGSFCALPHAEGSDLRR